MTMTYSFLTKARFIYCLFVIHVAFFSSIFGSALSVATPCNSIGALHPKSNNCETVYGHEHQLAKVSTPFPKIKNLYQRISFSWVKDLMVKGNRKPLQMHDLWSIESEKRMRSSSETFERILLSEISHNEAVHQSVGSSRSAQRRTNILVEFWMSPITRALVKM